MAKEYDIDFITVTKEDQFEKTIKEKTNDGWEFVQAVEVKAGSLKCIFRKEKFPLLFD